MFIKELRFWVQKVLPLVYDDSLSYMELLSKVVAKLNEVITEVNELPDYIKELISEEHIGELLNELLDELREQIASANEGDNATASADRNAGDMVWLDGKLAVITRDMHAGDRYVEDTGEIGVTGNFVYKTIEDSIESEAETRKTNDDNIKDEIGNLTELNTTVKSNLVGAINEVLTNDDNIQDEIGNLTELNTTVKSNLVAAINEVLNFGGWYVTPEMFGAVGDGVEDDTTAVRAAINAGVGNVILLNTYRIKEQLTMAGNIKLMGAPHATLIWDDITGVSSLLDGVSLSNITFENVIFDFGTQTELKHGISLISCENIKFKGCVIKNGYGYALRLNHSSKIVFEDCFFKDITGDSGNPGGAIYGQDMEDLTVTGCSCKNLGDHFVYSAGVTEAKNIIISDCNLDTCGMNGLTGGSAITLYANTHDVTITNCIFDTCRDGIYAGVYSSYITLPSKISVSNCIFKNIIVNAMSIFGISTSNRIKQFTVDNCQIDTAGQDGISIRHAERLQMNNIIIDKSRRMGLEVSDTTASMFSQFQITDNSDTGVLVGRGTTGEGNYNIFSDFYITASADVGAGAIGFYLRQGNYNMMTNIRIFSYPRNYYKGGAYNVWFNSDEASINKTLAFTNDITAIQYHNVGDVVFNSAPTSGAPVFWVCTAAGSPGTMKPVATLS